MKATCHKMFGSRFKFKSGQKSVHLIEGIAFMRHMGVWMTVGIGIKCNPPSRTEVSLEEKKRRKKYNNYAAVTVCASEAGAGSTAIASSSTGEAETGGTEVFESAAVTEPLEPPAGDELRD